MNKTLALPQFLLAESPVHKTTQGNGGNPKQVSSEHLIVYAFRAIIVQQDEAYATHKERNSTLSRWMTVSPSSSLAKGFSAAEFGVDKELIESTRSA